MNNGQGLVLVVDDNESNRDVLSRRLQRQRLVVETAENGQQALDALHNQHFDLVLLDIMMPDMNGFQVLEILKDDPQLQHIPVVMISAVDDIESVVRCIELGAEDYLFKPFNPILLQARVEASLEKKRLRDQERAYLQSIKHELELGRRTQADFLPATLPDVAGWQLTNFFSPAREVAGDFYDAFVLADGRVGLVIADVCDKGVGAALFMVLVRSLIRAFAEEFAVGSGPLEVVPRINNYIAVHHHNPNTSFHRFATLFFAILDPATATLTYINAGHDPPLIIGDAGIQTQLDTTGPAVGFMPDSTFMACQYTFRPGDMLIAYTDGFTEARNSRRELFGEARLLQVLNQPVLTHEDLIERLMTEVQLFAQYDTPSDDMTMLIVHRLATMI